MHRILLSKLTPINFISCWYHPQTSDAHPTPIASEPQAGLRHDYSRAHGDESSTDIGRPTHRLLTDYPYNRMVRKSFAKAVVMIHSQNSPPKILYRCPHYRRTACQLSLIGPQPRFDTRQSLTGEPISNFTYAANDLSVLFSSSTDKCYSLFKPPGALGLTQSYLLFWVAQLGADLVGSKFALRPGNILEKT